MKISILASPEHGLHFPQRTDVIRAAWWALYLEPMVGSGEKICVAVAVSSMEQSLIVSVPGIERLRCLYGKEVDFLQFITNKTTEQLNNALLNPIVRQAFYNNDVKHLWQPKIEGLSFSVVRYGTGQTLEDIAKSALMMCASLVEKLSDESEESSENLTHKRLEKNVLNIVRESHPRMALHFDRFRRVGADKRKIDLGYVSPKLAVNFAVLTPPQLTECVRTAKAKLWDLEALKTRYVDEEFSASLTHWELMLHVPSREDPTISERGFYSCQDSVRELQEESEQKNLIVSALTSPQDIAKHLIELENSKGNHNESAHD